MPQGCLEYVRVSGSENAGTYGAIQVQVIDEKGDPLIAKVLLTDAYVNSQLAITDCNGNYEIDLEPGTYPIIAEKTSYYFEEISAKGRWALRLSRGPIEQIFLGALLRWPYLSIDSISRSGGPQAPDL
ncbi:MAG: hypothetical protein WCY97_10025 [Methanothrix sp.]|uniref:Carboxypeptidase regulatory-like domain-containing protein n=1 Tax=Methanothrix harundinacea TaxID=301375 RepID=A0A117MB94_9EURY|nr:MAG: hypothetical protein APR56_01025 [Methanosaeta sp. SDB]KUK43660.1 MAG: hypothetical protein XD72_1960 [Methanothrix harundinacea]MDD2637910.1 hypothetical protein [Methanothrix sp.]KUK94586.1 MAG: hypothetical protein XE07_2110 [Methanothrix harundinacea]MCP1391579.1 hypothetical protein [Methanothrix harundinacea]